MRRPTFIETTQYDTQQFEDKRICNTLTNSTKFWEKFQYRTSFLGWVKMLKEEIEYFILRELQGGGKKKKKVFFFFYGPRMEFLMEFFGSRRILKINHMKGISKGI